MSEKKLPRCVGHDEMGCIIVADKQTLGNPYSEPRKAAAFNEGASYALDGDVSDEVVYAVVCATRYPNQDIRGMVAAAFAARKKELGI